MGGGGGWGGGGGGGGALDGYCDPWDGSLFGEGHLFEKIRYTYLAAAKLKLLP